MISVKIRLRSCWLTRKVLINSGVKVNLIYLRLLGHLDLDKLDPYEEVSALFGINYQPLKSFEGILKITDNLNVIKL